MQALNLKINSNYQNLYQSDMKKQSDSSSLVNEDSSRFSSVEKIEESKIHNSAVNVSISMESIKVFLSIKSAEYNQKNTSAQNSLMNLINNTEVYDFLSGKELESGFSLKSIGYDGKPITELNVDEAKSLVSEEGFFGIEQTSQRVSSFVIGLAGNSLEALNEVRKGVVQGFQDAEKLWGGELPEISHKTQEKTLEIIDKKIAEMLKTDSQKELDIS